MANKDKKKKTSGLERALKGSTAVESATPLAQIGEVWNTSVEQARVCINALSNTIDKGQGDIAPILTSDNRVIVEKKLMSLIESFGATPEDQDC